MAKATKIMRRHDLGLNSDLILVSLCAGFKLHTHERLTGCDGARNPVLPLFDLIDIGLTLLQPNHSWIKLLHLLLLPLHVKRW